jgi:hypothetical protein
MSLFALISHFASAGGTRLGLYFLAGSGQILAGEKYGFVVGLSFRGVGSSFEMQVIPSAAGGLRITVTQFGCRNPD